MYIKHNSSFFFCMNYIPIIRFNICIIGKKSNRNIIEEVYKIYLMKIISICI